MGANRLSVRLIHPYYNNNNAICQAFLRGRFFVRKHCIGMLHSTRFTQYNRKKGGVKCTDPMNMKE
nr:MAG TPA: hypothetical protein [Caudoviricetes sp.]